MADNDYLSGAAQQERDQRAAERVARLDRQARLDALTDHERAVLLAYLDGCVPAEVDGWFAARF